MQHWYYAKVPYKLINFVHIKKNSYLINLQVVIIFKKKKNKNVLLAHKGKIVIDTVIHIILRVKSSFSEIMTTFITYLKQEIIFFFILNTFIIPCLVWTISSRILQLLFYKSTCVWNFLYKVMREKLEFWYRH